jgi:hypothetical protein
LNPDDSLKRGCGKVVFDEAYPQFAGTGMKEDELEQGDTKSSPAIGEDLERDRRQNDHLVKS